MHLTVFLTHFSDFRDFEVNFMVFGSLKPALGVRAFNRFTLAVSDCEKTVEQGVLYKGKYENSYHGIGGAALGFPCPPTADAGPDLPVWNNETVWSGMVVLYSQISVKRYQFISEANNVAPIVCNPKIFDRATLEWKISPTMAIVLPSSSPR